MGRSIAGFTSLHVEEAGEGGAVVEVVLDHGRANEMGRAELDDWARLVGILEAHPATALITRSTKRSRKGTPIFVAGANVTERGGWSEAEVRAHVRRQRAVLAAIRRVPQFHLAVVDGVALGWGTELVVACDYRIATPAARFGLPETGLGIVPGAGGTAHLAALVGPGHALRLGMSGERIDSEEALRIGLIEEVAGSAEAALARARQLAGLVARRSPTAVAAYKRAVLGGIGRPEAERLELEARAYEHCLDSGEAARGRAAFKAILAGEAVEWGPRRAFSASPDGGG